MVTNLHQLKRVIKIIVSSFLRQATAMMVLLTMQATTAAFGVRRSALQTLTTLGACTSIRAVASWAAATVAAVSLCVGFAINLSFQPIQYMKVLQAAPAATKHLHLIFSHYIFYELLVSRLLALLINLSKLFLMQSAFTSMIASTVAALNSPLKVLYIIQNGLVRERLRAIRIP